MMDGVYVPPYRRGAQYALDAVLRRRRDHREDRELHALRAMRAERELELRIKEQELHLLKMIQEADILEFRQYFYK